MSSKSRNKTLKQIAIEKESITEYRRATIWDAHAITILWADGFYKQTNGYKKDGKEPDRFYLSLIQKIFSPEHIVYCALREKKLVGFGLAKAFIMENTIHRTANVSDVYVVKDLRGQGIGAAIFKKIETLLKEADVKYLEFDRGMEVSPKKMEKRGYKPYYVLYRKEL